MFFLCGCSSTLKKTDSDSNLKKNQSISGYEQIKKSKDAQLTENIQPYSLRNSNQNNNQGNIIDGSSPKKNIFDRITKQFEMKNLHSKRVQISIKRLTKDPKYFERVFKRSTPYLYYIVEELSKRNLPMELALLPFVESAYKTSATSSARAAGLWQFIPATGRRFNLKQNWWVDERRDVVKSTQAALDYLQLLYKMMDDDWFLALAAYNWGEASVRKAIKRNKARNKKTSYLYLKMPRETRYYVPKLLAVKEIVLNPWKYNIELPFIKDEPYFKIVKLNSSVDFKLLSSLSEIETSKIKEINAGNLRPVINTKYSETVLIPMSSFYTYTSSLEKIDKTNTNLVNWTPYTFKKGDTLQKVSAEHGISIKRLAKANGIRAHQKFLMGTKLIVPSVQKVPKNGRLYELESFVRPKLIRPKTSRWSNLHRVRRGESLSQIARKYRTSVRKIKQLNNLNSNLIYAGQNLKVFSSSQKDGIHKVRRGDSLYSIAMRYSTSVAELKRINKLASDMIKIGAKLLVQ